MQNVSREKYKKNVDCTSDCSTICTATAHCEAKSSSYNVTTCLKTDWIKAAQHSFTAHHDDDEDDHDDDDGDHDDDGVMMMTTTTMMMMTMMMEESRNDGILT